jgi:hypothetical protein
VIFDKLALWALNARSLKQGLKSTSVQVIIGDEKENI